MLSVAQCKKRNESDFTGVAPFHRITNTMKLIFRFYQNWRRTVSFMLRPFALRGSVFGTVSGKHLRVWHMASGSDRRNGAKAENFRLPPDFRDEITAQFRPAAVFL